MRVRLMAALLLCGMAGAAQAEPAKWDESWRWCRFDTECMLLKDECHNWISVNERFARTAYDYFADAATGHCKPPLYLPTPKVICNVKTHGCEVSYE